jgi:hypothetical protein
MKKTIAQELNIKKFPFEIKDENNNLIYHENLDGFWQKKEYDSNDNEIYFEDSNGYWWKAEYDSKGNIIYYENSDGRIYDKRAKKVELTLDEYDKRAKKVELTLDEIANKFGINVKDLRIKD